MRGTKPFELGLVLAGAVSAGAYTAGVIDFLIEALDRWEQEKRDDERRGGPPTVPRHDVMITAMTGASAGAMTTAMTAAALFAEHRPVVDPDNPPPPRSNRLYDCWVEQIDISKLLGTEDLEQFDEVLALLNSTALTRIAQSALTLDPLNGPPRRYLADPLPLLLTVSNLRGVPYAFSLFGEREQKYGMNAHMDNLRFAISADLGAEKPAFGLAGMQSLNPLALFGPAHEASREHWNLLITAALASGAFPIGLQPRIIERPGSDYRSQVYSKVGAAPAWPKEPSVYRFVAVDGGLMSNEPISLCHACVSSSLDILKEQSGHRASGALVLVDPFPNEIDYYQHYRPKTSLVGIFGQMFSALKSQARFCAEELELAANPDVYNRFAISPSRYDAAGTKQEPSIASEIMGGFGGFLSRSFRRHDFHLGRRNCQAFLARYFSLPETNPVFSNENFPPPLREAYYLRDRQGQRQEVTVQSASQSTEKQPLLPVIPLFPHLDQSPRVPDWPSSTDVNLDDLQLMISNRVVEAGALLIDTELKRTLGPVTTWTAKGAWRGILSRRVTAAVMKAIAGELARLD